MTYYEILQVVPTASPEVIKMAYKALVIKYHPDTYQGGKAFAEEKMKQLNEAYAVLSSPMLRFEYDRKLKEQVQTPPVHYSAPPRPTYQAQPYTKYQAQTERPKYQPQPERSKYQTPPAKKRDSLPGILWLIAAVFCIILLVCITSQDDSDSSDSYSTPTSPQLSTTAYTQPKTTAPPLPAVPEPESGKILSGHQYTQGSEITVTASYASACVVKLKNAAGDTRLSFYVRAGDTVTVCVPAEYLYVYFASGENWYGKKNLFGEDTYYSKDDELLDFATYTYEYTLYQTYNGNFSETPIDADEFN